MRARNNGFILPVVIVLSVAISIIGATALQVIVTSGVTLNTQYFNKIANEAARAGALAAASCLESGTTTWTTPLEARSNCNGTVAGPNYVAKDDNWVSNYSVPTPAVTGTVTTLTSTGTVKILNPDGTVSSTIRATAVVKGDLPKTTTTTNANKAVVDISSGGNHTCAVARTTAGSNDGKAYCWGGHINGPLGNGTGGNDMLSPVGGLLAFTNTPSAVITASPSGLLNKKVTKITAGGAHTCAIAYTTSQADATAYCWGSHLAGQTGEGYVKTGLFDFSYTKLPTAIKLPLKTVTDIYAGTDTTCAVAYTTTLGVADSKVYCWGDNTSSKLGDGTTTARNVPVAIVGGALAGKVAVKVSVGYANTCAMAYDPVLGTNSTKAYCWGYNESGQLGTGTASLTPTATPAAVSTSGALSGKTVTDITTGWGNTAYESCTGSGSSRECKTRHKPGPNTTCVVAYTTALGPIDSKAYCWGDNAGGQLGDGTTIDKYSPVQVNGGALAGQIVTQVSTGASHTCAVAYPTGGNLSQRRAYCWGPQVCGTLGNGVGHCTITWDTDTWYTVAGIPISTVPVAVTAPLNGKTVTGIHGSSSTTCATAYTTAIGPDDSTVYCWGTGYFGKFGNGHPTSGSTALPDLTYNSAIPLEIMKTGASALAGSGTPTTTTSYGALRLY